MSRTRSFIRIAAVLSLTALVAAPLFAAHGTADFTRVVALGDSLMAGYEAGSLNNAHQDYSPAAIFARQVQTTDFQQPLISYPGLVGEETLFDISKYPPTIAPAPGQGQPLNSTLARPYNNLGIPGARLNDLMTLGPNVPLTVNPYYAVILRNPALGATAADQALALHPTFILLDAGNNDFLGAALAGTPAVLTPQDTFAQQYGALLDKLIAGAPNAGIVVGDLPQNFLAIPYFSTVPPVLINTATNQPVLGPDGKPIYYVTISGGKPVQLGPGSYVALSALPLISQGYGIPAALKPLIPLPHVGEPLPDQVTLTADEAAAITAAVTGFNASIHSAASARNIPVAPISFLFNQLVANGGYQIGPFLFNNGFITGGLFSLDGIHPTEIGYTLMANEFIKATNSAYGTHIPFASIAPLLQNNDTIIKMQSGQSYQAQMGYEISPEAVSAIEHLFAPQPKVKLHAAHH